jgi:hypothetical protein
MIVPCFKYITGPERAGRAGATPEGAFVKQWSLDCPLFDSRQVDLVMKPEVAAFVHVQEAWRRVRRFLSSLKTGVFSLPREVT